MTAYYENKNAKKEMNELGLFEFFKSHNVIRIEKGTVFFNPFYLSKKDENGKSAGYGTATLSITRLALNFPELREKLFPLEGQ